MANRYWVGGSGNWSDDNNHWATISGGSPASGNLPTSVDDVYFDINSFTGTGRKVTLDVNGVCGNMDWTNSTNSPIFTTSNKYIEIYGNLNLNPSMIISFIDFFLYANGNQIFDPAGITLTDVGLYFNSYGTSGKFTQMNNVNGVYAFEISGVDYDSNGYDISTEAGGVYSISNVDFKTSTITFTGSNYESFIIDDSSSVNLIDASIVIDEYYVELQVPNGSIKSVTINSNKYLVIRDSMNLEDFNLSAGSLLTIQAGKTIIVTNFNAIGSTSSMITINSTTTGQQSTLSKAGGMAICDYLNIRDSVATGGAAWFAGSHSIDSGNNSGWLFQDNGPVIGTKYALPAFNV